jgi:enterochelin esterase family protein
MIFPGKIIDMKFLFFVLFASTLLSAQSFQSVIQKLEQTSEEKRQPIIERYLNSIKISPIIEQDSIVHFVLYGKADTVLVNGNLQHWESPQLMQEIPCGPYSLFYRTFIVPPDARMDYKYTIDGKEKLDPQNPNITPSGFGPHSELRMPKFVSSPYLVSRNGIARGTIDSLAPALVYPAPLKHYLSPVRPVKIYRPAGYDTLNRLPVVYVHDGFEAIAYARMPVILDNLIADGKIPPVLAVFIPPVNRFEEYIGPGHDRFVRFLADDLVPLIDVLYRTDRSPQHRAVIGISAGGHIALYAALKRPDVFQNVGGQSSAITLLLTFVTKEQKMNDRIPPQMKIYLDCGRYDIIGTDPMTGRYTFLQQHRDYSDLLSALRIPHYFKEVNDGHEWASWRERLPEMLIYFFGIPR